MIEKEDFNRLGMKEDINGNLSISLAPGLGLFYSEGMFFLDTEKEEYKLNIGTYEEANVFIKYMKNVL